MNFSKCNFQTQRFLLFLLLIVQACATSPIDPLKLDELPAAGFFNLGPSCVKVNGREVSGCDSPDAGAVLAVIGIIILVGLLIFWLFSRNKAEVDSPSSKEGPASMPVEEGCDPGMESCSW